MDRIDGSFVFRRIVRDVEKKKSPSEKVNRFFGPNFGSWKRVVTRDTRHENGVHHSSHNVYHDELTYLIKLLEK